MVGCTAGFTALHSLGLFSHHGAGLCNVVLEAVYMCIEDRNLCACKWKSHRRLKFQDNNCATEGSEPISICWAFVGGNDRK
jgi:hypothetical protein